MILPELLQWIQMGRKTGTAVFERRGIVKKVYFEEGQIVSASSNDPREYLGQILVFFGQLTESQLNEAFQMQKKKKKLLGKILVEDFGLKSQQILQSLRIKIEETVFNIFLWEDGKFVYTEGLFDLSKNDRLDTALSVDHVIFEGARRSDEWNEFRKHFPDDDVIFEKVSSGSEEAPALLKDPTVLKIYECINAQRSIQGVLLESHAPEYRGYEAFGKLYWAKLIAPLASAAKPKKSTKFQPDVAERLVAAVTLFKEKNFSEAFDLMSQYVTEKPQDEESQTLFKAIQEAYLKDLYAHCPPEALPELTMDFSDLNEEIYSSQEGYLASRINGEWDVKSLIMISPLGELESLKILKRLLDNGMVRLKV